MQNFVLIVAVLLVLLAASGLGMYLRSVLRDRHKTADTFEHVRLVISILVTFTAIVLGLLISEVKNSFDAFDSRLRAYAGDLAELDIRLREYGPDAAPIRTELRKYVAAAIADTWRDEPAPPGLYPTYKDPAGIERAPLGELLIAIDIAVHKLEPADNFHKRFAQSLEARMAATIQARRALIESVHDTISWPLLVAMVTWLTIVFAVFGLIAPRNAVVHGTIVLCALSFASALYFIVEFDGPVDGAIRVSSAPMRDALRHIDAS